MNRNHLIPGHCPTLLLAIVLALLTSCTGKKWTETEQAGGAYRLVTQRGGATLGYAPSSGIGLLTVDGYAFKDLNRNGVLDPYEDWRLSAQVRAEDLAAQLSVEEIAGLMLYSAHQAIPSTASGPIGGGTYGGKPFEESGADAADLTDQQRQFLTEDNLRHVLVTTVQSPEVAARWNNHVQALVEGIGHGIPANNSSDPRHGTTVTAEYNAGAGGQISLWPGSLGLAATFDPQVTRRFGQVAAAEYRALGIATALSPQVDMATDPRWSRVSGTFGEDVQLATDLARAYVDGFQTDTTTRATDGGWGPGSVNAMVKHWPGGGSGEGGRDAHYGYGKYAVYPGGNFAMLKRPFTEGAFRLEGGTKMASAVMPYYTISVGQNPDGADVGNSYNHHLITDQLRGDCGYQGVVCTDWMITADVPSVSAFSGKPWGVERISVAERHYRILQAGVDQFGGNNDAGPVLEAYRMGVEEQGEEAMRRRFEASAVRLLMNILRVGLFENPYLDPEVSAATVGNAAFMRAGYEAQLASIVMLKNRGGALPAQEGSKVYIPQRHRPSVVNFFGQRTEARDEPAVSAELAGRYFTLVDAPEEADWALVFMDSPNSGPGYDRADRERGGNGYMPISLQYEDYTAAYARPVSLAGGDPDETFSNRSYRGKTVRTANRQDMLSVRQTRQRMGRKPVVVVMQMSNPTVMAEFEPAADAIVVGFDVQHQALLDVVSGRAEPHGLLPMQMPADMRTVEEQAEDVPRDMRCHVDTERHTYDFAFGMDWKGVISDERTERYR